MKDHEQDERMNNLLAAGGVFMLLHARGAEPEVVMDADGNATNEMLVRLHWMRSKYRVTVTREPGTERAPLHVVEAEPTESFEPPALAGKLRTIDKYPLPSREEIVGGPHLIAKGDPDDDAWGRGWCAVCNDQFTAEQWRNRDVDIHTDKQGRDVHADCCPDCCPNCP